MTNGRTRKITLILGPAGCGKTEAAIQLYRKVKSEDKLAQVIYLAPTARTAGQVKERLLAPAHPGVLANLLVITFPELARLVIRAAGANTGEAPTGLLHAILKRTVQDAGRKGKLRQLGSTYQLPGFTHALAKLIDELKLAAVIPEAFRQLVLARRPKPIDKLIADLYQRYQDKLIEQKLYDRAGLYWQARNTIITRGLGQLENAKLLLVDGFSTFTPIQMSLLELIAERLPRTILTLPYEKDTSRKELFEATDRTLKELQSRLHPDLEILKAPADKDALRLLERNLFLPAAADIKTHTSPEATSQTSAIQLLEAPGTEAEVHQVAHIVKELIVKEGHLPEEIAILARNLSEYRGPIREAFSEIGIPFWVDSALPFDTLPPVTTFLDLVRLKVDDFPREATSTLAASSLFTLTDEQGKEISPPARLEALAVEAGIIQGQQQWQARLEAFATIIEKRIAAKTNPQQKQKLSARKSTLKQARNWINRLFETLEMLPDRAAPGRFKDACKHLFESLHFPRRVMEESDPTRLAEGIQAVEKLKEVIDISAQALELAGTNCCALSEFLDEMREQAAEGKIRHIPDPAGRVSVLDVHQARVLSFPVVFLLGLAEGSFPAPLPTCPFYDQQDRHRLARIGIGVDERDLLGARERLLFYQAVTRARRRLYLSRPTALADGRPRLASCYLEESNRILDQLGITPDISRVTLSQLLPTPAQAGSPSELSRAVLPEMLGKPDNEQPDLSAACDWLAQRNPQLMENIACGIEQERSRWLTGPSGFTGILNDPRAEQKIAEKFPPGYIFSVGKLNDYGSCPFLFFCQDLLQLEPAPQIEEELSALDLGVLYHRILFRFFRQLRDRKRGYVMLNPEQADAFKSRITEITEQTFNQARAFKPALKKVLVEMQKEQAINRLQRLVDVELNSFLKQPYRPRYFEAAFGITREPDLCDEISTSSALEIGSDREPVLVGGKIDRIDVLFEPPNGQPRGFAVIDYKSGAGTPPAGEVRQAINVQLQLYALAAQKVLLTGAGLKPIEGYFYSLQELKHKTPLSKIAHSSKQTLEELLQTAADRVRAYAAGIRAARFTPTPGSTCRYCAFRFICRCRPSYQTLKDNG